MSNAELILGGLKLLVFGMGMVFVFLVVMIIAMMSVPPVLPPWDMDIPIPTPAIDPPIIEHISLPLDNAKSRMIVSGIMDWNTFRQTDARIMAYTVFAPNAGPMMMTEIINSIVLITK